MQSLEANPDTMMIEMIKITTITIMMALVVLVELVRVVMLIMWRAARVIISRLRGRARSARPSRRCAAAYQYAPWPAMQSNLARM